MVNPQVLSAALQFDLRTENLERDIKLREQSKDMLRDLVREAGLRPGYYILSDSQILRVPDERDSWPSVLHAVTLEMGPAITEDRKDEP